MLSMGLKSGEMPVAPLRRSHFSLAKDISLGSRSCMRADWPTGKLNIPSPEGTMFFSRSCGMRFPDKVFVKQRKRPLSTCQKQAWISSL